MRPQHMAVLVIDNTTACINSCENIIKIFIFFLLCSYYTQQNLQNLLKKQKLCIIIPPRAILVIEVDIRDQKIYK